MIKIKRELVLLIKTNKQNILLCTVLRIPNSYEDLKESVIIKI